MKKKMILLASNLYIEAYYLQKAITYNIWQQKRIYQALLEEVREEGVLEHVNLNIRMARFSIKNR